MQTLNVNDVCQVRVNSINLGFPQILENITKSPCAKEKCDFLVLSRSDLCEWYVDVMVLRVFIVIIFI